MNNLEKAKKLLEQNEYTCVLCNEDEVFYSDRRGVKPLIEFFESKKDFTDFSAADKTIGAGAAHLYVLLGVKEVWARVISCEGESVLKKNNISVVYENKVPYIINRAGTDRCPIEKCVEGISDSKEAIVRIKETLLNILKG